MLFRSPERGGQLPFDRHSGPHRRPLFLLGVRLVPGAPSAPGSITPFEAINADSYKKFLQRKLPREKITLKADKSDSKIYIKKCFSLITYQNFFSNKEFNYSTFINYLVEHTFEPCSHNVIIEIQKNKLANKFAELFTKYLVEE